MPFWAPQPGPQLLAATCPADHCFFGGSRGGGKSDCLLGRQMRGAELYGNNWNGLIIRRKYKDFLEIRRRIDGLISDGLPSDRVGGDQMTNYWRFGNGAQVTLPAINELKQVNDFVGHQYCVAEGTPILMGDGSSRPIEEIFVGSEVMTLEGPKPVTRTFPSAEKTCVRLDTVYGEQVHPIDHRILAQPGWVFSLEINDTNCLALVYINNDFSKSTHTKYVHPYKNTIRDISVNVGVVGGYLSFCGIRTVYDITVKDANHYICASSRIINKNCEISIDEATTFPFFSAMVDKLKGSNRSPHGVPCHMFSTGNPGGPGHLEVKEYFRLGSEYSKNYPPGSVFYDDAGESRIFIPSFLKDNKILCDNDPKYVNRLMSIRDPLLKKAWIDGDWDVFIGQAFSITERHIIEPVPIPKGAPLYMTYDWGWGAPFSICWWWVDLDNRLYMFSEWYGWDGTPNVGLRMEDSIVAKGILKKEADLGITGRPITRLAGHDCWNKRPDYKGGGQGPSTAEIFTNYGLYLIKADSNRELKIRAFRERIALPEDPEKMPPLVVYDTCKNFIRTVPYLAMDDVNVEDIADGQESHVYDSVAQICMARPVSMDYERTPTNPIDKRLENLYNGSSEVSELQKHLQDDSEITERDLYDEFNWDSGDDDLVRTIW